jgi:predicted alpha/beta hydrolase family esterase
MKVLESAKVLKTLDISLLPEVRVVLGYKNCSESQRDGDLWLFFDRDQVTKEPISMRKLHKATVILQVKDDKILVYKDQQNLLAQFKGE